MSLIGQGMLAKHNLVRNTNTTYYKLINTMGWLKLTKTDKNINDKHVLAEGLYP